MSQWQSSEIRYARNAWNCQPHTETFPSPFWLNILETGHWNPGDIAHHCLKVSLSQINYSNKQRDWIGRILIIERDLNVIILPKLTVKQCANNNFQTQILIRVLVRTQIHACPEELIQSLDPLILFNQDLKPLSRVSDSTRFPQFLCLKGLKKPLPRSSRHFPHPLRVRKFTLKSRMWEVIIKRFFPFPLLE